MTHSRKNVRRAFTLIELLVVIAIIALLIGITVPVLLRARNAARSTACMNNSGQIVKAINTFSASNKGRLPENRPLVAPGQHITWRQQFVNAGYIPAGKPWACPAHPYDGPSTELGAMDNGTTCIGDVNASYALNGHLLWREQKRASDADRVDVAIQRPTHTILLAETMAVFPDIRVTDNIIAADTGPRGETGFFGYWHAGNGTYGFYDGHVDQLNLMDTGNPDCRWHNGKDYTPDPFNNQTAAEMTQHAHPDWVYLASEIYFRK